MKKSKPIIRIRPKPQKPIPQKVLEIIYDSDIDRDNLTLQKVQDAFNGADLKDISVYSGSSMTYFEGPVSESDESFSERVAQYEKDLKEWFEWREKNKKLIKKELKRKKELIEKQRAKKLLELNTFFEEEDDEEI